MKSEKWLDRQNKDIYVRRAKKEGYLSRAAYKLIEIENKYKIISKSKNILELGSSPGSWSQVIIKFNNKALVDAFDILDMDFNNSQIKFYNENILEFDFEILNKKYDLILSDLSPNTTGHKSTDHLKLITLIEQIINIVEENLKHNGYFIFKMKKGSREKNLINSLKEKFVKIDNFKPKSSRKKSSEIYVIAQNFLY
tara:strand:+ start:178 stop:768 length:591 start_codon:yes stop_codon:yes gene_type:complete